LTQIRTTPPITIYILIFAFHSPTIEGTLATPTRRKLQEDFIVLTITSHNVADLVVLHCHGRIVRGEESALLCAAVRHHGRDVVLDLGGVSAIDAAGIGALVSLQAAGVYLRIMNATEPVRTVMRLTGLDSVFEICEAERVIERIGCDSEVHPSVTAV